MCSVWLAFCDCGFYSVCCWWIRIRGLWRLPDVRDWLRSKLGLVLMGGAMFSKSLIQFSVDGRGCVPFLLFDLRPNYGGGSEDNGNLLQKVPWTFWTQCPQPYTRPLPTHTSNGASWTLTGKYGSVSVGSLLLFPGSWCTQFLFVPSKGLFPQSFISADSMVVFMVTSSKRAYAIPRFAAPRAPAPAAGHPWPIPLQETLKHSRYCIVIDYSPYTVHFILLTPLFFSWHFVYLNRPHLFAFPNPLSSGHHLFILWMYNCISVFFFYVCLLTDLQYLE